MVWVKICGITNKEDAIITAELGSDALGFILSTDSPRRIEPGKAYEIILAVKNRLAGFKDKEVPSFAGVFVNEEVGTVVKTAEELGLDFIQFSGDEKVNYMQKIKKLAAGKNIKLIKLIRVKKDISTFETISAQMQDFKKEVDYFLLDTCKENIYGGTGKIFDWQIVRGLSSLFPVILAGGLDSENVGGAINTVRPFGVDASTRLEIAPGQKDMIKVKNFIKNASGRIGEDYGKSQKY
jgi:phosphoribosylanthranilate isomerase